MCRCNMASIDQTATASKDICWGRGDSDAKGFIVQDSAGVAIDITGFTFRLTVNTEKDPEVGVGTELFTVTGVITDAANGKVAFAPTTTDTDQEPGKYFYDIEQTAAGLISTIIKGRAEILQDISK